VIVAVRSAHFSLFADDGLADRPKNVLSVNTM
jgi:hypothetical protein